MPLLPGINKKPRLPAVKNQVIWGGKYSQGGITMKKRITDILIELGIPAHVKGYQYLRTAIIICITNLDAMYQITKVLYPAVAEVHNTKTGQIERCIRHAIETGIAANPQAYKKYFPYLMKDKPTNSQFICTIADILWLEQEKGA